MRSILVLALTAIVASLSGCQASLDHLASLFPGVVSDLAASADTDGDGLLNGFESRWGVTSPSRADSDDDGLLDSAEDSDGDGLSNLGEQLFGTDPAKWDSDGNGISDGDEDANHDGIPNWRQQDQRPLPAGLTPSLKSASQDYRCYRPLVDTGGPCVGDTAAATTIALYGDSHAAQWLAPLNIDAKQEHWRLRTYLKEHCPSVHIPASPDCSAFRQSAERDLRANPPSLVIISNFSHYDTTDAAWTEGLRALLAAMPTTSRILVLADTPLFPRDVPTCLEHHPQDVGACEVARSVGIREAHDTLEASIADAAGATFASMNPWVCPYALCPVVIGRRLMWRDRHHLTVTFAKQLAPALDPIVVAALGGR